MRLSANRHDGPANSPLTHYIGHLYLKVAGWTTEGELPPSTKGVLIAAPHTSGWDLPYMVAVSWVFGLKLNWLGKHTLFEGYRGPFMRWLGGIAIDRRSRNGVVGSLVERFAAADRMYLAIAPAGTRSRAKQWRSGFYHIAKGAQVPIICGFLDFGRKVGGVGPAFVPTGDVKADMDRIRDFYEGMQGLRDGMITEIRLTEEAAAPAPLPVTAAAAVTTAMASCSSTKPSPRPPTTTSLR
ncbi:MAG: lysophospholipid acyltransferase family protein [Deltaproteobacteria bacterium]|nr:lysophospholipid acyltransferase family protein [Deltaproteobacteria bacterium]